MKLELLFLIVYALKGGYSLVVIFVYLFVFTVNEANTVEQQCTERFMELELVTYRAQQIGIRASGNDMSNEIRVLEEYQFNCTSTNITSVILGSHVRTVTNNRDRFPSIQLWRPNPGSPGQYLVDTDSERFIYYSASNISTNGVFEYPLNPPISVNSGDLLAISQPTDEESVVRVYYIDGINFRSREDSFGTTSTGLSGTLHTDQLVLVYPITGTIISVNFYFTFVLTDGYCVNSSVNATLVQQNALLIHESIHRSERQYIYPEMRFTCNGTITKWIYGGKQQPSETMLPELQIWRQLGTDNYNKTGSSLVTANTSIGTNLYEFIPQTPLEFQENDIFGVHIPSRSESQLNLYQQRESGPLNLQELGIGNFPSSTITTELQEDRNDFPLVTVEISKY